MCFDPSDLTGTTTWSALRQTPPWRRAAVFGDGPTFGAELRFATGECAPWPARVYLDFFVDRLERIVLCAEAPPLPANPRWWRREDELERHQRHVAWLAAQGLAAGWQPWGELACGYNSVRQLASVRWRFAHAGAPWNPSATVASPLDPASAFDRERGALRIGGQWIGAATTRSAFARTRLGALATAASRDELRIALGPGELFADAALVVLTFAGDALRRVDACATSECFGADWSEHGAAEAVALHAAHAGWVHAAVGGPTLGCDWGRLFAFADQISGHRAVRLDLA